MQFWLKSALVISVASILLGCSSSDEQKVINEDHQYINSKEQTKLKFPEGTPPLGGDGSYILPELSTKGEIGEDLDIQSPAQILALASGSRIDEDGVKNRVWFDRTNVVDDLPKFSFRILKSFLNSVDAEGLNMDETKKVNSSGWITEELEGGFWPWSVDAKTIAVKFDMERSFRAKGMIGSFQATLTGMKINGEDVSLSSLTDAQKLRSEINFINDYVYYFQLAQEKLMKDKQIARSYDLTLRVGEDQNGQTALRSDKTADIAWVQFRSLAEEIGFRIEDVDRSTRKLFLSYKEEEKGFWDSLWSDDDEYELDLAPGKYMVRVKSIEQTKSVIIFYDENELRLPQTTYGKIIEPLQQVAKKLALEL